ncbi:DUF1080 domain-containing protein [bacterium]|jgi:Domain of Unknown Function (DUF1080)|nr:DUF1080 domain-containing protein [bacterium]
MKLRTSLLALLALASSAVAEDKNLFNGKDLAGWKGLDFWSVQDGAIVGQTTKEHPTKGNTFLVWQDGEVADFELTFKYRITDVNGKSEGFGNSGVQYRSKLVDAKGFVVAGYQADFECGKSYSGILYEEKGRGILAQRGQKTVIKEGSKKPEVAGEVGKSAEIQAKIKPAEWNEYRIVAQGGHLQHFINGVQTIDVTDETAVGAKKGILALQLHAGAPMKVEFKDLVLKETK